MVKILISPVIRNELEKSNLKVLRDKRTKQPLNVSYTDYGLIHYSYSRSGRNLYNPKTTVIEPFIPLDFNSEKLHAMELTMIAKGLALIRYNGT
jgi:hypothetical protein